MDREFLASTTTKSSKRRGMSSWVPVTSGVPQGSVIGPILLLVYINDIPAKLQSKVRLFADDNFVYMAVTNEI